MEPIDVRRNRRAVKYHRSEQILRVLWSLTTPFFRYSPRIFWSWRRLLLRLFGAEVGRQVHVYPNVVIMMPWNIKLGDECAIGDSVRLYALGKISIGDRTTVSQGCHLCAGSHNIRRKDRPLIKPPIKVGDDVWIAADAFIGPDVVINDQAIVGARSVVMSDVETNRLVVGNPARVLKVLD